MRHPLKNLRGERGSVLIFVAVMVPVLIAAFAIVVDVGNWFVHKRSLQNEVDAAALAGGSAWGNCFNGAGSSGLYAEAAKYAGGVYNLQAGGSLKGTLGVAFNSPTYPPDAPSGVGPDDTPPDPCIPTAGRLIFDVKATEKDVPLLLRGLVPMTGPDLHATARVELRQIESLHGLMPLGVPDVRPQFAFAQFYATGGSAITGWIQLSKSGTVGGNQYWTLPPATPSTPVPISNKDIGVRIRLVGGSDPAAACGQNLVDCYDGLGHIYGWSAGSAPTTQNVSLLRGTCALDSYFAPATCSGGVQAEVDLGSTHPLTGAGVTAQVTASVDGGTAIPLTKGLTVGSFTTWNLNQGLPFSSTGPHTVTLDWTWEQTSGTWTGLKCTNKKSNPCAASGTFGVVQRAFISDPVSSGPVQTLQIGRADGSTVWPSSFRLGTTQNLTLTLATIGSFEVQAATANAPLITLRVAGGGSQNQSVDCDPNLSNLQQEIVNGCAPAYKIDSDGATCPNHNVLWTTPQPWYCVMIQTGGAVGQVDHGLDDRIQRGSSCTDDNAWPNYPLDDRRIVPVFLTPFGSFKGSGTDVVPITGFATFYITGYSGDPCPHATPAVSKGSVAGHFINYTVNDPGSTPSPKFCDINSLVPCIPVLVK